MDIVQKELEESKIYSNEQKNKLMKLAREGKEDGLKVVDLTTNRKAILKYFPRSEEVIGRLEYLSEEIVVSIRRDNELIYLPFKLRNINTMFSCLEESTFAPFFLENPKVKVKIERPIYNLVQKRF